MTNLESEKLDGHGKTIRTYIIGWSGLVAVAFAAFYFNTGSTLAAHEERLDKHDIHTEEVIILKQEVRHIKETDEVFFTQYRKDRDKMFDLLLEIKEKQR